MSGVGVGDYAALLGVSGSSSSSSSSSDVTQASSSLSLSPASPLSLLDSAAASTVPSCCGEGCKEKLKLQLQVMKQAHVDWGTLWGRTGDTVTQKEDEKADPVCEAVLEQWHQEQVHEWQLGQEEQHLKTTAAQVSTRSDNYRT